MTEEINKKARELVEQHCKEIATYKNSVIIGIAKRYALIACDGILKYIDSKGNGYYTLSDELRFDYDKYLAIKQAIENL